MRATTYSILAAFFSLAPLSQAVDTAAPARPRYYFPREVNRDYGFAAPAEKRAPQIDPGTTVVIVPVTVYVGPDGKPYTLGNQKPTVTARPSNPEASTAPDDDDLDDTPDSDPLGKINIGLPNLDASTGFPAQTPSPSPPSGGQGFPTLELPGLGTPSPPPIGGTGISASESTTAAEAEPTLGPILTLPPLFPSADPSSMPGTNSSTNTTSGIRSDLTDLTSVPIIDLPTLNLPTLTLPPILTGTPSMPVTSVPSNTTDSSGITLPPFPTMTVLPPDPTPSQNSSSIVIPTPTFTESGVFPNPTDRPTGWVPPKNSTTIMLPPPTTSKPMQTPPPSKKPEKPVSTDSLTSMIIPTSIVFQPTPAPPNPSQTKKPEAVPGIISPDSGIPDAPPDSTLIQIGFNSSLSYEFVVSNKDSNVQIFSFTPMGVAFGLQIPPNRAIMQSIQPYDMLQKRTYTTALALMYIPENLVNELSVSIHNPYSLIYRNPDPSIAQLMSMIDPSIPLIPGGGPLGQDKFGPGGGSPSGRPGGGKGGDGSEGGEDETEGPGGSGGSSNVKATSVGIGLGVVGGAALYGAAMFFVARRYRKKRKLHRRTSSLTSGMGEVGVVAAVAAGPTATDALMSGGRTDGYTSPTPYAARDSHGSSTGSGSGRNQMISAPVMAENSLGWN